MGGKKNISYWGYMALAVFVSGILIRIVLAGFCKGHATDIQCFMAWADRMTQTGCTGFYSDTVFTDYPPGYMYVLWLLGMIRKLFSMEGVTFASLLLIKLPAIVCNTLTAIFIYKWSVKRGEKFAVIVTMFYFLNPAILLNSAVWGQVDSIFTLCVVLVCYLLSQKKYPLAYFVFALGILIKPQTLVFTPVVLFGVFKSVFKDGKFDLRAFSRQSLWALAAVLSLLAGMAPFGIITVITQYINTMASYPYASVNAYNLWNALGMNWVLQDETIFGITYSKLGSIAIFLIVIIGAYIWYKIKDKKESYFVSAAVIIGGMFLFSVRMHERYLYPILALLLLSYLFSKKKEYAVSYLIFSIGHFINVFYVLYFKKENIVGDLDAVSLLTSLIQIGGYVYFIYHLLKNKGEKEKKTEENNEEVIKFQEETPLKKLERKDIFIILIISLIYGLIAFYNLGDKQAPVTFESFEGEGDNVILDFGESVFITEIAYYLGDYEERNFRFELSEDAEGPYRPVLECTMDSVFAWGSVTMNDKGQYIRIISDDSKALLGELVFYDYDGNVITPLESLPLANKLYDEQEIYEGRRTYKNGTYFDEVYHARTAYEYLNGLYSYENTHPPLGKIFIAAGIKLWGMNPFGWRFMGTVFGIFMLPVLYVFSYKLFSKRFLSTIITLLFAFDFMHFTQTRIATIDVFVTFFILLMYLFMYLYIREEKKWCLALAGINMGFAIACKWTGVYAGAGLAVLFFAHLFVRYRNHENKREYRIQIIKTCFFCLIFFVVVPLVIYTLSYLPFRDGAERGLIGRLLYNQQTMFSYHAGVDATHPYSSWWYQWPTMYRPIWYYSGTISDTVKEGISAFGNPLVWWSGIAAFFYCVYTAIKHRDYKAGFLCIAYLAQYLPWFFVSRITFIYHYFPSVGFVVLMIGYAMNRIDQDHPLVSKKYFIAYTALAGLLFVMFYPVLSGMPVSTAYVSNFLRWFDSWVLI